MGLGESGSNLPSRVLCRQEHHVLGKADVVRLPLQPQLAWAGWGQVCPPGTQGTHGAGELQVPLSRAAFPKALNLHCYWRSGLALPWHGSPSSVGCSPRSRQTPEMFSHCLGTAQSPTQCANSWAGRRDAAVTPHRCGRGWCEAAPCQNWGACGSQNQGLNPPHPLPKLWGDLEPRGHGAAAPGRHSACASLHPAADRDWCMPGIVPCSPAQCRAPQPAHAADPGQGLSHLLGQSRDRAGELLRAVLPALLVPTMGTATHF